MSAKPNVIGLFAFIVSILSVFYPYFQGHVVMGNNAVSPYQQVIEKTKSLSFRSQMLAMNIEKKQAHSNRNEVSNAHAVHSKSTQTSTFSSSFGDTRNSLNFFLILLYTGLL